MIRVDECAHPTSVDRGGEAYCGKCGKGLSAGAREWFTADLAPGYAERAEAEREARFAREERARRREKTYDLSGIYLDCYGITGLSTEELERLANACLAEIMHRAAIA